jgi:predicted DNA-binding transcriptional regulator AlpA
VTPPERLDIVALTKRLRVHKSTVSRWYKAGSFPPPHYLGDRRRWWLHEVEAWERENVSTEPANGGPKR